MAVRPAISAAIPHACSSDGTSVSRRTSCFLVSTFSRAATGHLRAVISRTAAPFSRSVWGCKEESSFGTHPDGTLRSMWHRPRRGHPLRNTTRSVASVVTDSAPDSHRTAVVICHEALHQPGAKRSRSMRCNEKQRHTCHQLYNHPK